MAIKNYGMGFLLGLSVLFGLVSCSKNNDSDMDTIQAAFTGPNITAANLSVRVIYLVPTDRTLNQQYTVATGDCITQLSTWYKTTLGSNKTFHVNSQLVETIQSTHAAFWFNANNGTSGTDAQYYFYTNTKNEIKALLGTGYDESKYVYLVYVDAAGTTGAGALGFTAMPENDLEGLTGQMTEPVSRWIGGAGHELGHAFGMVHPDNQNTQALMWTGYTIYPKCILQDADKTVLNASKFFY
jgi:predicted Zn-dependent protease